MCSTLSRSDPALLAVLDNADRTWTAEERAALELLRAWDGFAEVDSPGAAIWETTYEHWMRRVLWARLSPDLAKEMMTKFLGALHWALPDRLLHGDDSGWFDGTTREAEMIDAFSDAVAWLTEHIGPYPAEWEWGAVHRVTFAHPAAHGREAARAAPQCRADPSRWRLQHGELSVLDPRRAV